MPVLFVQRYTRQDASDNPNVLYVFGDNEKRVGLGGQAAALRGMPNAVGVCTKATPGNTQRSDYWSDDNFERNIEIVLKDLGRVYRHLAEGGLVVLPADGIGTGLSNIPHFAPQTHASIQNIFRNIVATNPAPWTSSVTP